MSVGYINCDEYKRILRKYMALAFVPIEHINACFELISTELLALDHNENHERFIIYFENTWIGRPVQRPLYQHDMWNARNVTEVHLPRTTNSLETWHNNIQGSLKCQHPNFFRLVEQLRSENNLVN